MDPRTETHEKKYHTESLEEFVRKESIACTKEERLRVAECSTAASERDQSDTESDACMPTLIPHEAPNTEAPSSESTAAVSAAVDSGAAPAAAVSAAPLF